MSDNNEIDKVRDEEGTTDVEADVKVPETVNELKGHPEIDPEVIEADVEEVTTAVFYLVEMFTGGEWFNFKITDPADAQKLVVRAVKEGTYTAEVENGIQVLPVKTAKVTGPYEVQATEDEAANGQ